MAKPFVFIRRRLWDPLKHIWKTNHEMPARMMLSVMGVSVIAPSLYMAYAGRYVYKQSGSKGTEPEYIDPDEIQERKKKHEAKTPAWNPYNPLTWKNPP